jgi:predicted metal-dependent hydrolase
MASDAISYAVQRSARKTIAIYVERDGSVSVRAPLAASDERVEAVVRAKQRWIYRTQARWAELNPKARPGKEFVSGETIYFLGQPHRLDFREDQEAALERAGDIFSVRRAEQPRTEVLLKGFYRQEGLRRLPGIVSAHTGSMGLKPAGLRVSELGHRWASCSADGTLNFNWKALAVPLDVLHYLVVHELAHLKERDHSTQFWRLVEAEMPGWKTHAGWLSTAGAKMTL